MIVSPNAPVVPRLESPHPCAEHSPELLVPALPDQVQVDLAERGQVPVGVILQGGDDELSPGSVTLPSPVGPASR